jgi:RluA family pseudouridine synthase
MSNKEKSSYRKDPRSVPTDRKSAVPPKTSPSARHPLRDLSILYEDRDILVVDKAPGLLTMGTETQKEQTAYSRLMNYVRKGNPKSPKRIFIVHRLDRDVSGVLVFAKSSAAKISLQGQWESVEKKYLAVVHGKLKEPAGTISSYLAENASRVVFSTSDQRKGKLSHTAYRVLKETTEFSLLEITLLTGRKNQIRVHMADIGHPIVGDKKYGDKNKDKAHKRVALHAWSLAFNHPFNGRRVAFETPIPGHFSKLVGSTRSAVRKDEDKSP